MSVKQQTMEATETSVTYPGIAVNVARARQLVRSVLWRSPRVEDIELIVDELIANAIQHTVSGSEGGVFSVTIRQAPGWARLEVADQGGGLWRPLPADDYDLAESGRGLSIVAALADATGHVPNAGGGQIMWADVTWSSHPAAAA